MVGDPTHHLKGWRDVWMIARLTPSVAQRAGGIRVPCSTHSERACYVIPRRHLVNDAHVVSLDAEKASLDLAMKQLDRLVRPLRRNRSWMCVCA